MKVLINRTCLALAIICNGTAIAAMPKANPYLAAESMAITHVDSSQSDSLEYSLPKGNFNIDLSKTPQVSGGPVCIMTLKSTSDDYMWSVSSGGVAYVDMSDDKWQEVSRADFPGVQAFSAEFNKNAIGTPFTTEKQVINAVKNIYKINGLDRISRGIYSLVDNDNIVYASAGKTVYAFKLKDSDNPASGIEIIRSYGMDKINKNDRIAGLSITYDGNLIILGNRTLAVIDREFKNAPQKIEFGKNEYISNSLAVDEDNGIYVASDKKMYKIVWTGTKLSTQEADGAWSSDYDTGEQPPVIKVGTGTGSTPTLMGFGDDADKLVVITDGANQMNLVAFWRNEIPKDFEQQKGTKSRRIAGQIKVTCGFKTLPKFIQSEQSVVVKEYGAFVVNNIGTKGNKDVIIGVMGLGPVYPPPHGAQRFEWDPKQHSWYAVWDNSEVVSTSMVPIVSIPSNMVLVNGYYKDTGWEVTGLDWDTGNVIHRTIFGQTNYGNGAYAILEIYPDNNLIFNSIAGPFRIKY